MCKIGGGITIEIELWGQKFVSKTIFTYKNDRFLRELLIITQVCKSYNKYAWHWKYLKFNIFAYIILFLIYVVAFKKNYILYKWHY